VIGVSTLQFAKLDAANLQGTDFDGAKMKCTSTTRASKGCGVFQVSEEDITKEELRAVAKMVAPYSRNATEFSAVQMAAELAPASCPAVSFESNGIPSCDSNDIARNRRKWKWFTNSQPYRRLALPYLVDLACEDSAIAYGIARNFREHWGDEAAKAANQLLGKLGKCRGLMDVSEEFKRSLDDDVRGVKNEPER